MQCGAAFGASDLHLQWAAKQQPPQQERKKDCLPSQKSILYARGNTFAFSGINLIGNTTPKWSGSDDAPLSEHVQIVLHSTKNADYDGLDGPCRFGGGDVAKDEFFNDGVNLNELIARMNELLDPDRAPAQGDEDALIQSDEHTMTIAMSETDHKLHAFLGTGIGKVDLGVLGKNQALPLETRSDGKRAFASPVPEPATWAMLVAGLATLVLLNYWKWKPTVKLPRMDTGLFPTSITARP